MPMLEAYHKYDCAALHQIALEAFLHDPLRSVHVKRSENLDDIRGLSKQEIVDVYAHHQGAGSRHRNIWLWRG